MDGFRTGHVEANNLCGGHHPGHQLGNLHLQAMLATVQDALSELFLHRGRHERRTVTQQHGSLPHYVVDQPVTVRIVEKRAIPRLEEDRMWLLPHANIAIYAARDRLAGALVQQARLVEDQLSCTHRMPPILQSGQCSGGILNDRFNRSWMEPSTGARSVW